MSRLRELFSQLYILKLGSGTSRGHGQNNLTRGQVARWLSAMSAPSKLDPDERAWIKGKYLEARRLLAENDPAAEPYRSCYEARRLLYEVERLLESKGSCREKTMLAAVRTLIGEISSHVNELDTAKRYLKMSRKYLKRDGSSADHILCSVWTLNQLGLLFNSVDRTDKTLKYLSEAERLYGAHSGVYTTFGEMFGADDADDDSPDLEKAHTLTLYYMAQAYRIGDRPVSATYYCHRTLTRQLVALDADDRLEWALNAAALSQVFLEHYMFVEARNHLAAAQHFVDGYGADLDDAAAADNNEERHNARLEEFNHRSSDVSMCWVKYDIMLLNTSKERLVKDEEEVKKYSQYPEELVGLVFAGLPLADYESRVTSDFVLTYDDARAVFLHGQRSANTAKSYYTLEEHASDYVKIQQDVSQLYSGLQFFEEDEGRNCKMWKRRADLLSEVVSAVNPVHYITPCREIYVELGEIYSAMYDSKSNQSSKDRDVHHAVKCRRLLQQAISSYQSFIDTFKDRRTDEFPEFVDEANERSFLFAHIYIARYSTKLLDKENDVAAQQRKNLSYYQYVVDYCKRKREKFGNDSPKILMDYELKVCEEMVEILPLAIRSLKR